MQGKPVPKPSQLPPCVSQYPGSSVLLTVHPKSACTCARLTSRVTWLFQKYLQRIHSSLHCTCMGITWTSVRNCVIPPTSSCMMCCWPSSVVILSFHSLRTLSSLASVRVHTSNYLTAFPAANTPSTRTSEPSPAILTQHG